MEGTYPTTHDKATTPRLFVSCLVLFPLSSFCVLCFVVLLDTQDSERVLDLNSRVEPSLGLAIALMTL